MGHSGETHELFEIPSDELRTIIRDDAWLSARIPFNCVLYDELDIGLGHRLAKLMMDNQPAVSVQERAQIEECPCYIQRSRRPAAFNTRYVEDGLTAATTS